MEKEFIPYEQALELKLLGFDEKCGACYYKKFDNEIGYHKVYRDFNFVSLTVSAPTFSQAFRWFREKYDVHGTVSYYGKGQWFIEILDHKGNQLVQIESNTFWSYEGAELACLKKLIEIVKEK